MITHWKHILTLTICGTRIYKNEPILSQSTLCTVHLYHPKDESDNHLETRDGRYSCLTFLSFIIASPLQYSGNVAIMRHLSTSMVYRDRVLSFLKCGIRTCELSKLDHEGTGFNKGEAIFFICTYSACNMKLKKIGVFCDKSENQPNLEILQFLGFGLMDFRFLKACGSERHVGIFQC